MAKKRTDNDGRTIVAGTIYIAEWDDYGYRKLKLTLTPEVVIDDNIAYLEAMNEKYPDDSCDYTKHFGRAERSIADNRNPVSVTFQHYNKNAETGIDQWCEPEFTARIGFDIKLMGAIIKICNLQHQIGDGGQSPDFIIGQLMRKGWIVVVNNNNGNHNMLVRDPLTEAKHKAQYDLRIALEAKYRADNGLRPLEL